MNLGDRLKTCREEKGFTQAELGKLINVSDATINRYERNLRSPDLDTLKKLAKIFNCSTDYMLGISDFRKPDFIIDAAASKTERNYDKPLSEETHKIIEDAVQYAIKKYGIPTSGGINDDDINKPGGKA